MGLTTMGAVASLFLGSLISLHGGGVSSFPVLVETASSSFSRRQNNDHDHGTSFATNIIRRPRSRRRISVSSHNSLLLRASKKHDDDEEEQDNLSNAEISRYSRHLVLSNVGVAGQKALKNAAVLVVGAGGLGSPCLLYLAAAGVGHIGIVDADTVDESNLQRQIIHGTSTIGRTKCQSAQRRIHDINPHVHVRLYEEEFTSATALRILGDGFAEHRPYDVVVDGSDNFPTKYLIK
jgi:ThiF family